MKDSIEDRLTTILACPSCRAPGLRLEAAGDATCPACGVLFPQSGGSPLLLHGKIDEDAVQSWDHAAAAYGSYRPKSGFEIIDRPLIEAGKGDVLEVGCGDGRLMSLVRDRCRSVIGVDPSPAMTAAARKQGLTALTAAGEVLPFRDECFDQVISGWGSMRYTDQDRAFPEVCRVLRQDGLFIFTLWNYHWPRMMQILQCWMRGKRASAEPFFRNRDVSNIRDLESRLASAGLRVTGIRSTLFPEILSRLFRPVLSYYRGRWGTRLGYHVILTCRKDG